ncbi:hypothetical protein LD669_18155 [Salmonella enterica]|nr:hypothetical protein [Salmonella enterica]MDJ7090086.1 hypothetical protein [Salmonella enterica]
MNEPVILFCRQWAITASLETLLSTEYMTHVIPVYSKEDLCHKLGEYRYSPVILGIKPHEHVVYLYHMKMLFSRRPVLFVARCFWWTDYQLPAFVGMTKFRFCTLDDLSVGIKQLKHLPTMKLVGETVTNAISENYNITDAHIMKKANFWLYEQMAVSGLSQTESRVLLLLSGERRCKLSNRLLSFYKIRGLYKLGMTKNIINLYRGVRVRKELQAALPSIEKGRVEIYNFIPD